MFNKLMAAPLKIKNFRRLYAAQVISDFGNWIDFTALLVLIAYKWELGSTALAFSIFPLACRMYLLVHLLVFWSTE